MPKLIKNNAIIEDNFEVIAKDFEGELPKQDAFIPLQRFLADESLTTSNNLSVGVWLDSDEDPTALEPHLNKLSAIAINFPAFGDGRGYSYARILRDQYGFKGELRAIGDVLHDQLFYLKRCGFDAYAVREDKNIETAIQGLNDFSNAYQAATVIDQPLFRRRS